MALYLSASMVDMKRRDTAVATAGAAAWAALATDRLESVLNMVVDVFQ